MAAAFDPYHKWLGIPPGCRPPTHYQLLAISPEERDRSVINAAVTRQSAYVRNFQVGEHGADAARILGEIQSAKLCLLDPSSRAEYDTRLAREAAAKSPRQAVPATRSTGLVLDLDAFAGTRTAPTSRGRAAAPRLRTLSKPKKSISWVGPAAASVACIAALIIGLSVRRGGDVSATPTSPSEPIAMAEAPLPPQSNVEPIAAPPSVQPIANSPSIEPIADLPNIEPGVVSSNESPVANLPKDKPATNLPSDEPTGDSRGDESTAGGRPDDPETEVTDGNSNSPNPPPPADPPSSEKQPDFRDLTQKLNDFASWTPLKGQWSKRNNGFHGRGDSVLKFNDECPAEFLLTFRMNVLEGMRPRIYFDEQTFWFGNEGFERTLFVYGEGQEGSAGTPRAYANRATLKIACRFAGEDVHFMVNGKPIAHCRRKKTGPLVLTLSAGDGYSPGQVFFNNFKLEALAEPSENVSSPAEDAAGRRAQ